MSPAEIVGLVDFRYLTDALTPGEALALLERALPGRREREAELLRDGYPAYTTSVGWLGYDDDKIRRLCREALAAGWTMATRARNGFFGSVRRGHFPIPLPAVTVALAECPTLPD
jgi:hypothetical protein